MERSVPRVHSPSVRTVVWTGSPWVILAVAIGFAATAPACAKPSSENIQLWKTTQKGPERLHDALADRTVAPRLRAEAAAALVDIGRADDSEALMAQIPAGERSEILKTLIPIDEV